MSTNRKVALVVWNPEVVDYSKYPGLTIEKLREALEVDRDKLKPLGYDAELLYIRESETAFDTVSEAPNKANFDGVLIGAGGRKDDEHFIVFEKLINAVHQSAPSAKICFNTGPHDTNEAVKRWI